jgi:acetamidase/formamidase
MTLASTKHHHLGRETAHHYWDREEPAVVVIDPGTEVALELRDGSNGQIIPGTTAEEMHGLDPHQMDPLTGPIWVEGAKPGDAISVDILDISLGSWGWSGIIPHLGLLEDHFPGPYLKIWDLGADYVEVGRGIRFDLRPMLGVVGVAPEQPGRHSSVVPTDAGGNLDVRYAEAGSRILLPVFTDGALLSLGDAHARQGDGELNGTAIECEADVVIRVDLVPGAGLSGPVIETRQPTVPDERYRTFLGVGPDLYEAARQASLRAVDAVAAALELDAIGAYALLGTIAELRIHEIVDRPNWVVGCMVPSRVFA